MDATSPELIALTTVQRRRRSRLARAANRMYTNAWIASHGLDARSHSTQVPVEAFTTTSASLKEARHFEGTWLRQLDRLVRRVLRAERAEELTFLDTGCGTGIAALFAAQRFRFRSVRGFDFEEPLVERAMANRREFRGAKCEVEFFVADAAHVVLPDARYVNFFFNSFDWGILRPYLENNLQMFRDSRSYFVMNNDLNIDRVVRLSGARLLHRDARRQQSIVSFGAE